MIKPLLDLFKLTEERANELFKMFLDKEGNFTDEILKQVKLSKIPTHEKMFMCYALGVLSAIEVREKPSMLKIKENTYIH